MTRAGVNLPDLVRSVVDSHRHLQAPLLIVLRAIQDQLGYLDHDVIPLVAAELNLSRADVHGVVSFYRDFRAEPVGRITVRVCRAEACQSVGAEQLMAGLERAFGIKAGQTTGDGSTTLDAVFCLGNCALGPSAQINGRVHGKLDLDRVRDIMRSEAS
jgi:formate dehydrogenase subunit gamma